MSNASDFIIESGTLKEYTGSDLRVMIPETVTEIFIFAFSSSPQVTQIEATESVTRLSAFAFANDNELKKLVLPAAKVGVQKKALDNCTQLEFLVIGGIDFECFAPAAKPVMAAAALAAWDFYSPADRETILAYVKKQKKKVLCEIVEKNNLAAMIHLLEQKVLVAKDMNEIIALCATNTELQALLMDYANGVVTSAAIEKAEAKKQEKLMNADLSSAAELKKLWSTKKLEDGTLLITNYKGTEVDVVIPAQIGKSAVTAVDDEAFSASRWKLAKDREGYLRNTLRSVTISEGITSIGDATFNGCRSLEQVTFPSTLKQIKGRYAFMGTQWMKNQTGLLQVAGTLLACCEAATSVEVAENIHTIAACAFIGCKELEEVHLPQTITCIGESAFTQCESLKEITIPANVTVIHNEVFSNCLALQSVSLPENLSAIGDKAFEYCIKLAELHIPASVTQIGIWAFVGCKNLTIYVPAGSYAETYARKNKIPFVAE